MDPRPKKGNPDPLFLLILERAKLALMSRSSITGSPARCKFIGNRMGKAMEPPPDPKVWMSFPDRKGGWRWLDLTWSGRHDGFEVGGETARGLRSKASLRPSWWLNVEISISKKLKWRADQASLVEPQKQHWLIRKLSVRMLNKLRGSEFEKTID